MNIGFLTEALPYLPAREGFRLYAANILKGLSARHRVDLVSLLEEGDEDQLEWSKSVAHSVTVLDLPPASVGQRARTAIAGMWQGFTPRAVEHCRPQLAKIAAQNHWDVLHVEGKLAATFAPDIGIPRVLALHDSWTWRYREMRRSSPSLASKARYLGLSLREPWVEKALYPKYDCCTVVGMRDAEEVRRVVPRARVECIPNGTDTEYFRPLAGKKDGRTVVFHSRLDYAPNVAAAVEFVEKILPRIREAQPDVRFHLVGASPSAEVRALASHPGVHCFFDLPDIRPVLAAGDVYVCAIRFGTGVKNKLLEAMAVGVPCVSYPQAVVGIDCVAGEHLLVAEDAGDFARTVVELLANAERRALVSARARSLVEEKYSWNSRVSAYEDLFQELAAPGRKAAAFAIGGATLA